MEGKENAGRRRIRRRGKRRKKGRGKKGKGRRERREKEASFGPLASVRTGSLFRDNSAFSSQLNYHFPDLFHWVSASSVCSHGTV